jgi:hypothetical protein
VNTPQAAKDDHRRASAATMRWRVWLVLFFVAPVLISLETGNPVVALLFGYVILYPSFAFVMAVIKILRFNFFPSPLQLWKGFRRQWHVIEKGPVVVRVHRKKPSST